MHVLSTVRIKSAGSLLAAFIIAGCGGGGGGGAGTGNVSPGSGAGNTPPTIEGRPATTVMSGQSYSFQPSASDANGDRLTFSISNLPTWASFDAATGRVSGTPAAAHVATYNNVTISVSDGTASISLAPFSITVSDVASGVATLSWTPPTQNTDGSSLSDLAGYEIRYGRSETELSQTLSLTNASLNTYVVENLTPGTWYFAVVSVNRDGVPSQISNIASKTVT